MALSTQRFPLMRSELSGNLDAGESAQIFSLRYDGGLGPSLNPVTDDEDKISSKPIIIYDYKMEVATDGLVQMYQQYCNYDATPGEMTGYLDWNTDSEQFKSSLKQHKLVAGSQQAYYNPATDTIEDKSQFVKSTLYYKAKGYWSKRHKEWRWSRPPIILSKNRKNYFALQLANVGNSDNRSYYALVTIKNYQQIL